MKAYPLVLTSIFFALTALAQTPLQGNPEDECCLNTPSLSDSWYEDTVTWTTIAPSPQPSGRSASGVLGNYMYVFGSGTGQNIAMAFNLTTEQWENSTPAPLGYDNWTGVATHDAIYLIGRYYGGYGGEIQRFTPFDGGPTGTWAFMADYPRIACGVAAAWDGGNYIYAAGGNPSSGNTTAYKYDIATDIWNEIAPLPLGRSYPGGGFIDGKFYVYGGTLYTVMNTLVEYDPVSNSWTQKANLPVYLPFATFGATQNEDYLFSVGNPPVYSSRDRNGEVLTYHPISNVWSLETSLPIAIGTNSARWIGEGKIISTGGFSGSQYLTTTYLGTGFPGGASPHQEITMTPVSPPIVIPAQGGIFSYNATLVNHDSTAATFQIWTKALLPTGNWYGPILGPLTLSFNPGQSLTRPRQQSVPASAPAGIYAYRGWIGIYPDSPTDSSSFTFTKTGFRIPGSEFSDWSCAGHLFPGETVINDGSAVIGRCDVHPNPFNTSTVVIFELRVPNHVILNVFDVSGRHIASLAEGWQEPGVYEVAFDGTGLVSGLYFIRMQTGDDLIVRKMMLVK